MFHFFKSKLYKKIYILFLFLYLYNWKKFFVPIFVLRLLNKHHLQRLGTKNQNELLVKFKDKLYLEQYYVHNKFSVISFYLLLVGIKKNFNSGFTLDPITYKRE